MAPMLDASQAGSGDRPVHWQGQLEAATKNGHEQLKTGNAPMNWPRSVAKKNEHQCGRLQRLKQPCQ